MKLNKKASLVRRVKRRIERFLNSRRGRICVIVALALGTTMAVACHPVTRKIVIGYWSRFNHFFSSTNQESTNSVPLVETSSKSSTPTWKKLGLFGGIVVIVGLGLWSGKIDLDGFNFSSRKDEVVTVPSKSYEWDSYPLPSGRRGWIIALRTFGGAIIHIAGIPVCLVSLEVGLAMQAIGWQMATYPIYN